MRLLQILIALDQMANALLGGYADETLSARAHRMREKRQRYWGWTANAIDAIFFWEDDHCRKSYESEFLRRQLPAHYQPAKAGFFTPTDSEKTP